MPIIGLKFGSSKKAFKGNFDAHWDPAELAKQGITKLTNEDFDEKIYAFFLENNFGMSDYICFWEIFVVLQFDDEKIYDHHSHLFPQFDENKRLEF